VLRSKVISLVALALLFSASAPAHAHFPVSLNSSHNTISKSPVLIDGTISFAVYADFTKAKEQRHVRFALKSGDELNVEYLIVDAAPTNKLKKSQLPSVIVTSPSGKKISLPIKERTPFFEPYGKKNYFYLARLSEEISESRALQLIGMKESGAEVCAAANRWLYRVGERDGEPFAVTMDYRPNRVTVSVRSGTISAVTVG